MITQFPTNDQLREIFDNHFSCYADTTDGSVVLAMDGDRFIEVVRDLLSGKYEQKTVAIARNRF